MRLQGMYESLDQMRASGRARNMGMVEEQLAKFLASDQQVPTELVLEARLLARETMEEIDGSWTSQEAVDVYASHYGKNLSDEELDQIISYWSSPIGQKDVEASSAAITPFVSFIAERNEAAFNGAVGKFQDELKALFAKHRSSSR